MSHCGPQNIAEMLRAEGPEHLQFRVHWYPLTFQKLNSTVFWVITPWSSNRTRRFGGNCRLHLQDRRVNQARNQQKHSQLKTKAICSFETSCSLRTTRHYNPEDRHLHSHRRDSLRSNRHKLVLYSVIRTRNNTSSGKNDVILRFTHLNE
jgi:hypothetical protein